MALYHFRESDVIAANLAADRHNASSGGINEDGTDLYVARAAVHNGIHCGEVRLNGNGKPAHSGSLITHRVISGLHVNSTRALGWPRTDRNRVRGSRLCLNPCFHHTLSSAHRGPRPRVVATRRPSLQPRTFDLMIRHSCTASRIGPSAMYPERTTRPVFSAQPLYVLPEYAFSSDLRFSPHILYPCLTIVEPFQCTIRCALA